MRQRGTLALRIYRQGTTLIMTVERDLSVIPDPGKIDQAADHLWRQLTSPCFEQPWQEFTEIFAFEGS
jgi:hypothetical protein